MARSTACPAFLWVDLSLVALGGLALVQLVQGGGSALEVLVVGWAFAFSSSSSPSCAKIWLSMSSSCSAGTGSGSRTTASGVG